MRGMLLHKKSRPPKWPHKTKSRSQGGREERLRGRFDSAREPPRRLSAAGYSAVVRSLQREAKRLQENSRQPFARRGALVVGAGIRKDFTLARQVDEVLAEHAV